MTVATSSLNTIQQKVRRLTRSPSENLLTTADLNQYINTFVLYDFPEQLKLFNLRSTFKFYTEPYVDTYSTNNDPSSPFYQDSLDDFINKYLTIMPPVYIAGYQAKFMESRDQFFGIYPKLNSIASIGVTGDGMTTTFSGVVNSQQSLVPPGVNQMITLLPNNVLFSSIDINNQGLALSDYPVNNTIGTLSTPGQPAGSLVPNYGQINYITGAFTLNFLTAPGVGQPINSQTVPQQPSLPQSILFYDGQFTVRPVPDQTYSVEMEVYIRPTELLSGSQTPNLNEWWQYIAYGASKKIFEDRMDIESVQQILPEFKTQEALILRRTIVQQTSQRAATIYTEDNGASGAYGPGWFSGGGSF